MATKVSKSVVVKKPAPKTETKTKMGRVSRSHPSGRRPLRWQRWRFDPA